MGVIALQELIEFAKPSSVDTLESGAIVLRRVKYLGGRSTNVNADGTQNVYTLEARQESEDLYEGTRIYANHPPRNNPSQERKVSELLGSLRGPFTHEQDGSYADVHLNPKHPLVESVAWNAEHAPNLLGLSHNAQGRGRVSGRDRLIESIARVRSVDLVTTPATTNGLFESQQEQDVDPKQKLRAALDSIGDVLEMVDEAALVKILSDPDMYSGDKVVKALGMIAESALASNATESASEEPAAAPETSEAAATSEPAAPTEVQESEEVRKLRLELDALKAKDASRELRESRDELLAESKLPKEALSDLFVESVYEAKDEKKAQDLIEDRRRVFFKQHATSGVSYAGGGKVEKVGDFLAEDEE